MANKIYKKLPVVLQTTAIKNFFDSTVEQLFSKANVEVVTGYIGSKTNADLGVGGYITEPNSDKSHYALSPVVNTINYTTKESEDFIFFDELIDILSTYGVDTSNQNKIFGSKFYSFVPPIDIDKFVNYQEYYWYPDGPTVIAVAGTIDNPIDIDRDVIGKQYFTMLDGRQFKNSMVVRFKGEFVIPSTELEIDYIVQGVGESIYLVPRKNQFQTVFSTPVDAPYDGSYFPLNHPDIAYQAGNISSVSIVNRGIGYVNPSVSFTGSNTNVATATANIAANGAITAINIVDSGQGYTNLVNVVIDDIDIDYNIDVANLFTGSANVITTEDIFITADPANVRVGQSVTGIFSGVVSKKFNGAEVEGYFGTYLTVPTANVNIGTETFTFANHGLATDDEVIYDAGGGTPISSVSDGGIYKVLVVNNNSFQLKDPGNSSTIVYINDTGNNLQGFIKKSTTFTVTTVVDGELAPGVILHNNNLVNKTKIVSQISGTTGGVGVYRADLAYNTVRTTPETFTVKSTVVLGSPVTFEKVTATTTPTLSFSGRDFLADVNYDWQGIETDFVGSISGTTLTVTSVGNGSVSVGMMLSATGILPSTLIVSGSGSTWTINKAQSDITLAASSNFVGYPAGARLGINPSTGQYYLMGGQWSYDRNDMDDDEFDGDALWDAGINASPPEYLTIQRGAENTNIWSTINFWYHKDSFINAGMELPSAEFRAKRPIIEFDRRLELYNHGKRGVGSVIVACTGYTLDEVRGQPTGFLIDSTPVEKQSIIFPNESPEISKYVYVAYTDVFTDYLEVVRAPHPELNPIGAVDGDYNFVPWELEVGDVVLVRAGAASIGSEYTYSENGLVLCQRKLKTNQAPLFNLYDIDGDYLGDPGKYPNNNFQGNKIFSYAVGTGVNDNVLGFPLTWKPFKASSEIEFLVDMAEYYHVYQPYGGGEEATIGYKFYKLELAGEYELLSHIVPAEKPSQQRLVSKYTIDRFDVDQAVREFWIGCVPDSRPDNSYDINVTVNGVKRIDWTYGKFKPGYIVFDTAEFSNGDFIYIDAFSTTGQLVVSDRAITKFEIPLEWKNNPLKIETTRISSPQFTQHFKNYMERQVGFEGDALQINNFSSTPRDTTYATDIAVSEQDGILGALLLDDQPHNLIDAIRFNAEEYSKYKARLKKEINAYYALFDTDTLSNEYVLEKVLQNIVSYNIGKNVFNRTYVIPYGDNYIESRFEINDANTSEFVSTYYVDLNKIENSLLVYHLNADTLQTQLLIVDKDYTISSFSPLTLQLTSEVSVDLDDEIILKIYDAERDSAQCPPTPSTLGLFPLHEPTIELDNSFQTPVRVLIGHDGSRTTLWNDRRDELLLEFEKRVYNSAKAEFRIANALPELNLYTLKPGIFRNTGYTNSEWASFMRYYFSNWVLANKIDFVTNEFYSDSNEWTWNYRGADTNLPGHWRGWFEYYYDTVRPHTHPWEMLSFFEKPTWWDVQYGTDYSSNNTDMWNDLEEGIIRQGLRENITADAYLTNNPYRREGLHLVLPVDSAGDLRTPKEIASTGTTTKTEIWNNSRASGLNYKLDSFVTVNGLNVTYSNSNIYVSGRNITNHIVDVETNAVGFGPIEEQDVSYNIPNVNLNLVASSPTTMPDYGIAVLVNGIAYYTPKSTKSWNDEGDWHYNNGTIDDYNELSTYSHSTAHGLFHYHSITPDVVGLTTGTEEVDGALAWDPSEHSPIVGWAFDGLPIYGPYGYRQYDNSGTPVNSADIVNIKSPFRLRQGARVGGPGGSYTGMFVEDYEIDAAKLGQSGYTNQYNLRYGKTPDSPSTPIWFYVVTIDDNKKPMFPYAVGGGYKTHTASTTVWAGKYYAAGQELDKNNDSIGTFDPDATPALTSTLGITYATTDLRDNSWKFGDGAPAENAWKYTESYPFAVVEALLLAKPGKFATEFADPIKLYRPSANKKYKLSTISNELWKFTSTDDFEIHGDIDINGEFITNIGYTQFINTWLRYQNLSPVTDFATKVRSLNTKLGHRMSGFIDKDTMTLRTDQYSNDGSATSLVIPHENVTVLPHSSPYKTRNYYSGVIIEKIADGYKVRGFDKNQGYFNILESDKTKGRERVSVGGTPSQFVDYSQNTNYKAGTIVRYKGAYYSAKEAFKTGTTFENTKWKRLGALPQENAAIGTLYQQTTGNILRVDYESVFADDESLYDFLISLGRYHASKGYTFGNFDETIGEVRDWAYAAKQFLFWTTGAWETGNTLELSPMANKVTFTAPRGFIAKINRSDRSQFNIVNQNGAAINPSDCEIVRQDNAIEITPPTGEQIYGVVLYTKEIEHAFVVDNTTQFNDVIFNPQFNQGHSRFKIKATRTAGWDGRFLSEGFIIGDDSLKPNLDNMAESLGRYHELGFIPVEKQLYEASRAVFGFEKKDYLTELDIVDDQQYDFYAGMLQSKGTSGSLSRISTVVPALSRSPSSAFNIYDEWALRVGDFGDVNQDQSVELKLDKGDIVQDPQLFTLAFPEDTTNIVEKIEVLERRHKYFSPPQIIISAPPSSKGVRATAEATLKSNGELDSITVTNPGSGYGEIVGVTVIAGNIVVQQDDITFETVRAFSTEFISTASASLTGNLSITDFSGSSNVTTSINLSTGISNIDSLISTINSANAGVTAYAIRSDVNIANSVVAKYILELRGNGFTINSADANLYLNDTVNTYQNGTLYTSTLGTGYRFEPRQRYGFEVTNITEQTDISVKVNGSTVSSSNWEFDKGDRWQITTTSTVDQNNGLSVLLNTGLVNSNTTIANENYTTIDNNNYPFVDVFVNGVLIENRPDQTIYSVTSNSIQFANISLLPISVLTSLPNPAVGSSRFVLSSQANVYVVEKATIDFTNTFKGDVTGSTLNIMVESHDNIAIKLGTRRNYEITPDAKDDDIILIDIDDSTRFLKKPSGVREHNLWPTTSSITYNGLENNKYAQVPNAGYVNPSNINFMAYDISGLPDLFDSDVIIKPAGGSLIHMANDESNDWNVYKLDNIGSRVSFVQKQPGSNEASLYTDKSLFQFLDTNMIGNSNTSRYMDYYLTLKNADVSDNVVIWTNETIIQQKQALIKDPQPPKMIEARIKSIGPHPDSVINIQNIVPVSSKVYRGATVSASDASNTVTITNVTNSNIKNGDAVQLVAGESTDYTFNANVTFNSVGNITVYSANTTFVTAPSFVTLLSDADANANGNIYYVKSKNVSANTFVIESSYFANANVVSSLGNVRYITSTFVDYGGPSNHYIVSNATTNSFTITLPGVTGGDVDVRHMNLTKLVASSNHSLSSGDVVKVYANAWTGAYIVNSVPESNAIIVSAPYTYDTNVTGTIITRGLQIKTTDPHGIPQESIDYNKRVAVHFASPKAYNKIYRMTSVGSDTIDVRDEFTINDTASVYFDVASGFANISSNVITISSRPLLQSVTVLYASNTQPVIAGDYYIEENLSNTTVTFKNRILHSNANVSSGFVIIREPIVTDFRYPVVTTVDHTKVTLNNSVININSYNNPEGMVSGIKRAIDLRRRAISTDSTGKLNISFNMLEDFTTPVNIPNTDISAKPSKIHNYGPYVRDAESLTNVLGNSSGAQVVGDMRISDSIEHNKDPKFDTGPSLIGPLKGMKYQDQTGVSFYWDIKLRRYIPVYESILRSTATGIEFEIANNPEVSDGSEDSVNAAASEGDDFTPAELPKPALTKDHVDGGKVLTLIPGSADSDPSVTTTKGAKWKTYDMSATVTYNSVVYKRWRLKTSEIWQFEVYEAIENSAGTVYYILVDIAPTNTGYPYDYFATVSAYNTFSGSKILEDTYYVTDTAFSDAGPNPVNKASANANSNRYIEIPPVEPAFFVGKQIIPEPFAVNGGNGTSALANLEFLPKDLLIGSLQIDKETNVVVTTPGHNSFLMWQPGLTSGKWEPQPEGPGNLAGSGGSSVGWGFGRGYYALNDNHVPNFWSDDLTALTKDAGSTYDPASDIINPYPGFNADGWYKKQPRFKYSKQFKVFPLMNSVDGFTLFDEDTDNPSDAQNTKLRADEIFVACFWTEPHTYKNQMIGFDYNNKDNDGNPTPVYKDYQGTITRVKYIRLTELPADAVMRRPIADTGWGGERWKNIVSDSVVLPGDLAGQTASPDSYGVFSPDTVYTGGSTGNGDERPRVDEVRTGVSIPSAAARNISQIGLGAGSGFGRGTPEPYRAVTIVDEKNKDNPAPVLTGSVLEGLPSACDILSPNPVPPKTQISGPCTVRPTVERTGLLTEKTNDVNVDETHVIKIQGKKSLLVIFDFSYDDGAGTKSVNGITIEQSATEDFSSGVSRYIIDTQTDGSNRAETNGSQIGRYGFDVIPDLSTIIYKPAENALGVLTQRVLDNPLNKFNTTPGRTIAETARNKTTNKVVGVSGFGFLSRTVDCSLGQFVRITVSKGSANKTGKYALFVKYSVDAPNEVDVKYDQVVTDGCAEAGSRAYKEGGIVTAYTYSGNKNTGNNLGTVIGAAGGAIGIAAYAAAGFGASVGAGFGIVAASGPVGWAVAGAAVILGGLLGGLFGKKKKLNGTGYFGSWKKGTLGSNEDNIYYPYSAPTQEMINNGVDRGASVPSGAKEAGKQSLRTFGGGQPGESTTFEVKGYFYAPKSGTYSVETSSDDASYVWISDKDDLSGEEKYKADGNHPELGDKNYNWQNAVVNNGGLHASQKRTGSVYLKGGGYYFVRVIYGNGAKDGVFNISINGPGYSGPLLFSSRSCPEDDCGKFRAGEMKNLDPVMKAVMEKLCPDTPTFSSTTSGAGAGSDTAGASSTTYGNDDPAKLYGSGGGGRFAEYSNFEVNFAGYSQPGLTGYNFMPSSFKKPNRSRIVDPQKYGYTQTLEEGRYVNATQQRVTGGFTIPLAKQLTVVSRTATPLKSYEIVNQPWYRPNAKTLGDLNTTLRNVNYAPKKIGTSMMLNGVPVNNITTDSNTVDDNNTVTIKTLNEIPATFDVETKRNVVELGPTGTVDVQDSQVETGNITYTKVPTINITPLTYGDDGSFVPAGPTAIANIFRPTPQVKISANDLATVAPGTELYIGAAAAGARVVFVEGTTPRDIASQIKCNQSGVDAKVLKNADGTDSLLIRSCSDNSFAVKNGCGGGTLKRVGDFHIVRGFEQTTTTTNTESCSSNATVLPTTSGYASNTTPYTPTAEYTLYDCNGNTTIFPGEIAIDTGFVLPSKTTTTTRSSTYMSGGSGYQIGDRLRLLGGTPTNNTRGPLGSICVNFAGLGYNNAANLRISFGNDNSPGVGASAEVTSLDEFTGAITGIRMLNPGVGYDVKNPPTVTITDISPRNLYTTVDATNLPGLTYTYNTILEVQNFNNATSNIVISDSTFYRVVANTITLGAVTTISDANISPVAFIDTGDAGTFRLQVANASAISGKVVPGGVITLLVNSDGDANANVVESYMDNVAFTVDTVSGANIFVKDSYFTSNVANIINSHTTFEISLREPIESAIAVGALKRIPDQRMAVQPAEVTAKVGVVDRNSALADPTDNDANPYAYIKGYKSLAGPLRVAKFIVTGVDGSGAITSLRILDRGLYKVFPADLTQGIPLEYDYDYIGSPGWASSNNLGVVDPSTQDNTPYGVNHPEYSQAPFVNGKHPSFSNYTEWKYDPTKTPNDPNAWVVYTGSPGAYDPQTSVEIAGQRLAKQYDIVFDPLDPEFGNYVTPLRVSGGTGARVFLTADEVPDCSEKGRAKEDLGLPDQIADINAPEVLADALNDALRGAGYLPEDISVSLQPAGPGVGKLVISTNYPSVNIDTDTPGFPEKLGIELGDYNAGMLCIEAEFVQPDLSDSQLKTEYENLYKSGPFGLLSQEDIAKYTSTAALSAQAAPPTILSLLCVDSVKSDGPIIPDPDKYRRLNPNLENSGFNGDGSITFVKELYKYDIRNIFGDVVSLNGSDQQNVNVYAFASQRWNNVLEYNDNKLYLKPDLLESETTELANAWVDSYFNLDPANISMPDFVLGGWAYLENGIPQRWQTPLVDTNYVKSALIYDPDTGNKTVQFDLWDPFKGVLPGFVSNEIHYISENDPVNYNNARTNFGLNNVGKVWWDTSTVKYMWYEQGSNRERWINWGRTFPGSAITVCEWVESKALPQNWNGNGTPRWPDRYVSERRIDPDSGKFVTYYYYWVQNRTVVDDRIKRSLGREMDTETIARYIANPVGYGLTMASFISDESFVLHNISTVLKDENVIQININRNSNSDGIKHTAWKLVRENDNNSIIPEHISDKLIDSLCGENAIGQVVPDPTLSEVEKYGIGFRPRQTLFRNLGSARRALRSVVNELLIDLKLETQYSTWDADLPTTLTYLERVNWYEVERVDNSTNTKIRYDSSYKPIFNVGSVGELFTLKGLPDGTVIQVKSSTSDRPQLWMYTASSDDFKLISIKRETLQIKESSETSSSNATLANELRILLNILRSPIFNDIGLWNKVFFEMLKHAYAEQTQLSWAFKTSYLYIEKDEEDLIPTNGFKPDNFARIIEYMNEVKPFTAKIREYRDGKRAPIEVVGPTMVSDFDKPPYIDRGLGVVRVLDDFSENDANIMFFDNAYKNYFSITNKGDNVFRHNNTTLVFDRTNYELTQFGHNRSNTTVNVSIARNIANINQMNEANITASSQMRAIDRIFKFDPIVRASFVAEVNSHFNNSSAGTNTSIITNASVLHDIINAGNLSTTLTLVKEKVGGGWRGELLDANLFTNAVAGLDSTVDFLSSFGWDTDPWDMYALDRTVEVVNYEGIFSELAQGNITLRRNNDTYEGFDGATFKKILYGEERPEEMVFLDPLESLIIDVYTSPYAGGNTSTTPVSPDAIAVKYRMHQNLFGDTEYVRITTNKSTTLSANVYSYSTEITVVDGSVFQTPRPGDPGIIWVGTERILYDRLDGNVISQLTRGSAGTSIQDHLIIDIYGNPVTVDVIEGSEEETFNRLDTNRAIWLEVGSQFYTYQSYAGSNVAYVAPNQLSIVTTANAIALLNAGGVVSMSANGTMLTANGTHYSTSYTSNVTFFYITDIDNANLTITVEDDLFLQDGLWDYYGFDSEEYDDDISEFINGNTTITLEIPTLNTGSNSALSLADVANADYANVESLMKFIHGI
jgi:hypothetical protein